MSNVSTSNNNNNNSILNVSDEEYEKQFRYIQALKRMEFFANKELEAYEEDPSSKEKAKMSSSAKISSARASAIQQPSQASFDEEILSPDECKF